MSANERDASRNRNRICEVLNSLGPAVHPSECAFRRIAPIAKGPVSGSKLHLVRPQPNSLETITKLYSNHMDKKIDDVVAALESGRSRFDSSVDNLTAFPSEDVTQNGPRDSTFSSTMRIEYLRSIYSVDGSPELCHELENSLTSQIWTQHVMNLPMPKATNYLRQEPDNLTTMNHLKPQRSSDTSSFSSEVMKTFSPHLPTSNELQGE